MSMTNDGVWKSGVWATTVWAQDVWFEIDPGAPSTSGMAIGSAMTIINLITGSRRG